MTSRERVELAVNHKEADKVPVDFDGTAVSGMHVSCVEQLRIHYGLEKHPVKIHEPFQCLGELEPDLAEIMGIDTQSAVGPGNFFGFKNENWKEWRTPWGQDVLVPGEFNTTQNGKGDVFIYPQGDLGTPPSGHMPEGGYFFDALIRQPPLPDDDEKLILEDNLEEFGPYSQDLLETIKNRVDLAWDKNLFSCVNAGGTGLGDIALVPAVSLKYPKGIRDVTEWYMSTALRPDFISEIFERQYEIALTNLEKLFESCGNRIGMLFVCGTDFGTQTSTFCSTETFRNLYMKHYRKLNDWIHYNTTWKTFKHSCGAVADFMPLFIESGFDIINPVQTSAKGMDPEKLKHEYGRDITFWGGGVDTQKILPFGTPEEVREEVLRKLEIFSRGGGYVFNAIHNIQAKTPVKNMVAMIDALKEYNS
jgi:hypothetical protein